MKRRTLISLERSVFSWFRSDGSCGSAPIQNPESEQDQARVLFELLTANGLQKDELVFGIPSNKVFFIRQPFVDSILEDSDSLRFALEEHLPVDAENIIPVVVDEDAVLAWNTDEHRGLIFSLESNHGIRFSAFVPVELIVASNLNASGKEHRHFVSVRQHSTERFEFNDRSIMSWTYQSGPPKPKQSSIEKVSLVLLEENVDASWGVGDDSIMQVSDQSRSQLLSRAVEKPVSKSEFAEFDFSEPLRHSNSDVRSIWEPLLLATLLLLICLCGTLGYQAFCMNEKAREYNQGMIAEYRDLFPGRRLNGPVETLLAEELELAKQRRGLLSHGDASSNLLLGMKRFLDGIPSGDFPFEIRSMTFTDDSATIEGALKSPNDFQQLKTAMKDAGFNLTASNPGKVFSLTLAHGNWKGETE